MSEPTETAAQMAIAGATAFFVVVGLEPQVIVWGLVGSVLGVSLAAPSSKKYAFALFIAATLTCSLLGTAAADQWWKGSIFARNVITVGIGAAFHPALAAFIAAVPGVIQWGVEQMKRRFGGTQ
jgi:hypothetical protein